MAYENNQVLAEHPDSGPIALSGVQATKVGLALQGPSIYTSPDSEGAYGGTINTGDFDVHYYGLIVVFINVKAIGGTNPSLQLFFDTKLKDGSYVPLANTAAIVATGTATLQIGTGTQISGSSNAFSGVPGQVGRVSYTFTGTNPTATVAISVQARRDH